MPVRDELERELKRSELTKYYHASYKRLPAFPSEVIFKAPLQMVRLDISNNNITIIPDEIKLLVNLKDLWVSNNPIDALPESLAECLKLETIDMRMTKIDRLPPSFCLLKRLYEIDWRDSPLQQFLEEEQGIDFGDVQAVKDMCLYIYTRLNLRAELLEALAGAHFASDADKPNISERIEGVVEMAYETFTNLDEFRIFVRRVDKLLPHSIDEIHENSMVDAREAFYRLRDDTTRQRLAADVEIKLRGIYYDMVEPPVIEAMIKSIYEHVATLEDVQFLVKYARQVMPDDPLVVTGALVWENILALQADLTSQRETSVNSLNAAMAQLYPEQEAHVLLVKAQEVAAFYQKERFATKKEMDNMSQLTAEVGRLFPPDFMSVVPAEIIAAANAKFGKTTVKAVGTAKSTR